MNTAQPSSQKAQAYFFGLVVVFAFIILALFPRLSFPIASAYVAALVLKPAQDFFKSQSRIERFIISILMIGLLALLIWPLVSLTGRIGVEVSELSSSLPRLEYLLRQKFIMIRDLLLVNFKLKMDVDPIEMLIKKLRKDGGSLIVDVPKVMGNVIEWLLLTPVFTWFFLSESSGLKKSFLLLVPNSWLERTYMLLYQFNGRFGGYIVAKTIEATILSVLLFVGLLIIDFPYALLLGIVGGVTNIVPYVGPILGWGSALLVGIMQADGSSSLLAMTVVYMIANFVDMALVFPLLVSKIVNLHPLIVVASVILGSEIGGLVGMIVSVPVATFLKLVIQDVHKSLYVENQR
ncbi:MAG: AI-2E family transporter [Bacteriovoracaceae bacterium]|nr:AI-2E family transporter [Bacteriovoracaceae bacterium]